ncbi:putative phosphoserine transaminase [Necator americanus]|uniref:phosphoserine transaminase n=1 Tax=Necator americanus TaxID=51031 RepID=W2TS37_NECAM|nr:putative phosphoserine transaminase [Necator americanus]ETN83931.1 putative phosphoserine transaminase [Necator americanus]
MAKPSERFSKKIPDEFEILFMQGGGTGQFAAIPLNIKGEKEFADYIITGAWSSKAAAEGSKYIRVKKVFVPAKPYVTIPDQSCWDHDKDAAYLYYCANETVHGIEFHSPPYSVHGVPLVADISSNFLSRPFDFTNHGVVFGGTQKNLGAAGLTVVIVRKDLVVQPQAITPAILSYKEMHDNNSLYNTPAVYGIYLTNLVLKWIRNNGGVDAIFEMNKKKSGMIYDLIDNSNGFYTCAIDKECRSYMNICFRVKDGDEKLEADFLKGATARGMISLKGHRSVGGIRASLYNAVTVEETALLADWMQEFMTSQAA